MLYDRRYLILNGDTPAGVQTSYGVGAGVVLGAQSSVVTRSAAASELSARGTHAGRVVSARNVTAAGGGQV